MQRSLSLTGGGVVFRPFFFCWGRTPSVQHRPRVTYSGTAKGPLLGGLPIVSGLEGVCDVEEKETGLNPAACCENAWSGVKALENKARHGGEEREGVRLLPSSPPALQGLGWAVNVEGAVRERGGARGKVLPSLLLSLSLEKPRRAPLPECCGRMDTRKYVWTEWYARRLRGVL